MSELFDLSPTAAGNTELFPEGMQFRNVNDGAREFQSQVARDYRDTRGVLNAGGSVNAFTITAARTITALAQGMRFAFKANATITGACTLNVSGIGAREIVGADGQSLIAGDILDGQIVEVVYRADLLKYQLVSQSARDIPDDTTMQAAAETYIGSNPDDVRNTLWVVRPIASATTTTAPTGATDGTLYLIPAGASGSSWASNADKIAEAIGGSWTYHTPAAGWSVYAKDTDTLYVYDTSWEAIRAASAGNNTLAYGVFAYQLSDDTVGGTPTTDAWTTYPLNTAVANTLSGATLSSNVVTSVPAGTYLVDATVVFYMTATAQIRVKVGAATYHYGTDAHSTNAGGYVLAPSILPTVITLEAAADISLEYVADSSLGGTQGLGRPNVMVGNPEIYGFLRLISIDVPTGPKGDDGDPGADGRGYYGSSVTSLTIGTGSKTLTTQSGMAFRVGDTVKLYHASGTMRGDITAYSSTSMTINVTETTGSGTYAAWSISITGPTGAAGAAGVGYGGTSTTSLTINAGAKTWTTQAGMAYVVGGRIRWSNSASAYMEGTITDYTGTSMTVSVDKTGGSGTLASWSAQTAGMPGLDGAGSGTVTDITASGGVESDDGATITSTGGVRAAVTTNAQTGTSYTFVSGDRAKLVTFSNASAIAVTLAQAQSATRAAVGFTGWHCWVLNKGAGAVTITPTTSTIAGAATLVLSQYEGALIVSDGTNYQAIEFSAGAAIDIYALIGALTAETAPSASDEIELQDVSAAAARRMTLANLFKVINLLGAETAPAADDTLPLYDTSASDADTITLSDLFKVIANLTADTSPDSADSIATYDASASAAKSITIANLFKSLNTLTAKSTPVQNADYVVAYSAGDAAARKILLNKIGVGREEVEVAADAMDVGNTATKLATVNIGTSPNSTVVKTYVSFPDSSTPSAFMDVRIPKGCDPTSFTAIVVWSTLTSTSGNVMFNIAALASSASDSYGGALGTTVSFDASAGGTLNTTYVTTECGAVTPAGSAAAEDTLWIKLWRNAAHASDTLAAAVRVHKVVLFFTRLTNTDD